MASEEPSNQVERVYRLSIAWRWVALPGLTIFFLAIAVGPASGQTRAERVFCGCLALCGLGAVWLAQRERLELLDRSIRIRAFRTREFPLSELSGFRTGPGDQYLIARIFDRAGKKRIELSVAYEKKSEILSWLKENLVDLDAEEAAIEEREIAREGEFAQSLGRSVVQRDLVRWIVWSLTLIAAVVAAVLFYWRRSPQLLSATVLLACLLLPAVLLLKARFRTLVSMVLAAKSKRPSVQLVVFLGLFLPWFSSMAYKWADEDTGIFLWGLTSIWGLILAGLAWMAILRLDDDSPKRLTRLQHRGQSLFYVFLCLFYGHGLVASLNGALDFRPPLECETRIMKKNVSGPPEDVSHSITVGPFCSFSGREVTVSRRLYEQVAEGERVQITVHRGALGIEWIDRSLTKLHTTKHGNRLPFANRVRPATGNPFH